MTSNYSEIRKENIREYGEGTRHLALLGRLYSDRTHFIYELLQNAEDARAKRVKFTLFGDYMEVFHDGRSFDPKDVRGICGVDEGTKAEDLTKIGKFGVGFKSVYAYTQTPEIHSGDEHFCIKDYVRPYAVDVVEIVAPWTTRFVFPFKPDTSIKTAFTEIAKRLKALNIRTLLFLKNITEIEWQTDQGEEGIYIRDKKKRGPACEINIIGQASNEEDEEEQWLVFDKEIETTEGSIDKSC